jgi:ABC-type multidrug transport system fused ATPase/permease subunit
VTFRYAPELEPVLEDASMRIEAGEHVGIVGRTGAGKSTLVSLIPRFYDPECGAVRIDGIDVRDMQLASLRQQVSLVLQDPVLFHGSVYDNISYGNPEAPLERVLQVADLAHVTEFLDRLPNGIDTTVGERGATLSGGQRQRIAVARAMLADAPILILDEPTTGLDHDSEAMVLDGLALLSRGRTTIVISHHEAALRDVTRVVHVADHGLVESPRPGELTSGVRARVNNLQEVADAVVDRTFTEVSTGYSPDEVDAHLVKVSEQLRLSAEREEALLAELEMHRAILMESAADLTNTIAHDD